MVFWRDEKIRFYVKTTAPCLAIFLLPGCVSRLVPQPPNIPNSAEVRTYLQDVTGVEAPTASGTTPTPTQLAEAGYNLVDLNCDNFFNALTEQANDTRFNRQEVTLGGALIAGTLAAAKASAASIAISALAGTFVGASLDNFESTELFAEYSTQTYQLEENALSSYRKLAPPTSTAITDNIKAQSFVEGYAKLCTYAGIESLVSQAILKAPTGDLSTTTQNPETVGGGPAPAGVPPPAASVAPSVIGPTQPPDIGVTY